MKRTAVIALAVLLVLAACGDDDDDAAPSSTTTTSTSAPDESPTTTATADPASVQLTLTEVARLEQPIALAVREGTPGFYVAEKGGRVHHLSAPGAEPELILDMSDDVSTGNEQGLLGLAVAPDGGSYYVSYTNTDGDSRIDLVNFDEGGRYEVFATDQPYANHNGGNILFGPDGKLWLGLGDGGAGGDPENRAQNPDTVLGKLLRFDLTGTNREPEIYALGARNPWRFSFDRETDDLWVGDVGQDAWEEIDRIPAGTPPVVNLGWPQGEGTHGYKDLHPPEDSLLPVFEYGRDDGQSVVGGYVYRGEAIPDLVGTYLFADTYTARVRGLRADGDAYAPVDFDLDVPGGLVSSFGEDAAGELYVLSLDGGVFRIDAA